MKGDSAHKSRWEIAEVVFGVPFLISIAIHIVVPFSLPPGSFRQILMPVGIMLIIPEEQYLAVKFGEEYKEYTASVHRWLGRK